MENCFSCGRKLKKERNAITEDGQIVSIGSECFKKITKYGFKTETGPIIYRLPEDQFFSAYSV